MRLKKHRIIRLCFCSYWIAKDRAIECTKLRGESERNICAVLYHTMQLKYFTSENVHTLKKGVVRLFIFSFYRKIARTVIYKGLRAVFESNIANIGSSEREAFRISHHNPYFVSARKSLGQWNLRNFLKTLVLCHGKLIRRNICVNNNFCFPVNKIYCVLDVVLYSLLVGNSE